LADIRYFVPRHEKKARENLTEFVRLCREDLNVFGDDLVWQDDYWPSASITFGNLDQTTRKLDPMKVMQAPFLDFAKAYLRYQQGHRPTLAMTEKYALKCLERALLERCGTAHLEKIDADVLDRAAMLAREHFSPGTAYQAERQLNRLASFVSANALIPRPIDWKCSTKRPNDTVRTGTKAREHREKKLPSNDALDALAEIFAKKPTEPRDIFTTCVAAMLLCAPSRISEVLALPADCEVWETKRNGIQAYGWRFQPGKGGAPMIKWIPDAMVSIAQEAIRRVRQMTAEARKIAAWYEETPDKFYRHENCPLVGENQPLTIEEAALAINILGTKKYQGAELRRFGFARSRKVTTLASIHSWARAQLPDGFPWFDKDRGIRFSQALFSMQLKQLHTGFVTCPYMVDRPTTNVFNNDLTSRLTAVNYVNPSIFDRHGFNSGRDKPLKVTSHQFRHLLNTMAQRGGLSQAEIARWSGRVDVKQNRVYDHMSEFELADMVRSHDASLTLNSSLVEIAKQIAQKIPMSRAEFNTLTMPTAHVTEYGFCVHDFVMSPCQRFRDCLNCSEQVCVKGDRRLDRIRARLEQVKQLKARADEEIAQGSAGADRWYEIHALTEKRLGELISILDNPAIEAGTIVRLRNENEFSPLRRAIEANAMKDRAVGLMPPLSVGVHIQQKDSDG
jgi:hypothetical protein